VSEPKPLQPMSSGHIVIIGVPNGFDEQIRTHPRVVLWSEGKEHWTDKDLPANTKAVFLGRFLGHKPASKIIAEARKRRIVIFNSNGTGMIAKQVRELLGMPPTKPVNAYSEPVVAEPVEIPVPAPTPEPEPVKPSRGKLVALLPFIDLTVGSAENGRRLWEKAKELGIDTTLASVTQMVIVQRRKAGGPRPTEPVVRQPQAPKVERTEVPSQEIDASVEMFDTLIQGMRDMREFLVATVDENSRLKQRIAAFKKVLDGG